jgi:hypothetical protein
MIKCLIIKTESVVRNPFTTKSKDIKSTLQSKLSLQKLKRKDFDENVLKIPYKNQTEFNEMKRCCLQ